LVALLSVAVFELLVPLPPAVVLFELVADAAGFPLGAVFSVVFETLFLLGVLFFATGFFLESAGLVFFGWEDFFEDVAIVERIIQKKGNVVKGVAFGS
jgi:hypothetical protein